MSVNFWKNKKILVTGGAGFIGSHLVETLVEKGAKVTVVDKEKKLKNLKEVKDKIKFLGLDLREIKNCQKATNGQEMVFNLAARVAGIKYNTNHPVTMFYDNSLINLNMLKAAHLAKVKRFLVVSSACVYRHDCPIPTPEEEGFVGDPEPTNLGYGWAKRLAEIAARTYHQEYGMKIAVVRPYNAYGPRDNFDPKTSHVIPALIRRVLDGEDPVIVWGSGEQSRAFLYVEDLALGMLLALEKYPIPDPINLGTEEEVKIKDLIRLIAKLSGKNPKVVFDESKPEGQPRRNCATYKAREKIGFVARTSLEKGLKKTIAWYKNEFGRKT